MTRDETLAAQPHQEPRPRDVAPTRLAVVAALLSAGAGAIHADVVGPHFEEYAPFGIAFAATALLQTAWAVGVLVAPSRRLFAAGLVGNAGVIAAWALSRTAGLPLGPDAWTPEPVTALDAAATAFELVIVGACAVLLRLRAAEIAPLRVTRFAAVAAVAAAALTAVPIAVDSGDHHGHGEGAHTHSDHGHGHAAHAKAGRTRAAGPRLHPRDHAGHTDAHP